MIFPFMVDEQTWFDSLIVDFPKQNIPALVGMDWKTCGNAISELPLFKSNDAPSTDKFDDWNSWAKQFFNVMAYVEGE